MRLVSAALGLLFFAVLLVLEVAAEDAVLIATHASPVRSMAAALVLSNGLLFDARWGSGLSIYDVSVPERSQLLQHFTDPYAAMMLAVEPPLMALLGRLDDSNLYQVSIREFDKAARCKVVSSLPIESMHYPSAVAFQGNYVFLMSRHPIFQKDSAQSQGTLQILDVRVPDKPRFRASMLLNSDPQSIHVWKNHVYLVEAPWTSSLDGVLPGQKSLVAIDAKDPDAPREVGRIAIDPQDITYSQGQAFAVSGSNLLVFGLDNPRKLRIIATLALDAAAEGHRLAVAKDRLFCIHIMRNSADLVSVYDVSTPRKPALITTKSLPQLEDPSFVTAISRDVIAVASDGLKGLSIFDVSDARRQSNHHVTD